MIVKKRVKIILVWTTIKLKHIYRLSHQSLESDIKYY